MRMRTLRRGGLIGLVAAASLIAGALPASAAPGDGSAFGLSADVTLLGLPLVSVPPQAPSNADGQTTNTVLSAGVPGLLATGVITTTASLDETTGAVSSTASTAGVDLLGLLPGAITAIDVACSAVESGVTLSTTLVGADLGPLGPILANPAPNTTISVPSLLPLAPPIASLIFNEQIDNEDGSRTVNGLRIVLTDGGLGGIGAGEIIVSSATCGPAALPVPLASGAGLWISLGLIGMAVVPIAVVLRRRAAATVTA